MSKRSVTFSIFVLLFVGLNDDGYAKGKPDKPPKPGSGGGGGCSLEFEVGFSPMCSTAGGVCSDGHGTYISGVGKLRAWSGDRGGLRFDSNGSSQKIDGAGGTRELCFDFPTGIIDEGNGNRCSGFDLRISHEDQVPARIALCDMNAEDDTLEQNVSLSIAFNAERDQVGNNLFLGYGIEACGEKVHVVRTGNTWEFTPIGKICLFKENGERLINASKSMPFTMNITTLD